MDDKRKLTVAQQQLVLASLRPSAAAWLLGMAPRTFADHGPPRNADGSYDGRALVEWAKSRADGGGDPLLAGGDSPSLERYRAARAALSELELAEKRGRLVDVDAFAEWFQTDVAAPVRRAVEALQTRFGADAAALMVAALSKAEAAVEKRGAADA